MAKRRKKQESWLLLWVAGTVVALVVGRAAVTFVGAHWQWFTAGAVVAAAGAVAFIVLRARLAVRAQRLWLAEHLELERVDQLSGPDFERLTAELLRRDGFREVMECGRSGDRGVDITAVGSGGRVFAFQCKRYTRTVGAPEVRNFLGALAHTFAGHTGVLVTSGRLTRAAHEEATAAKLILVERDRLARWLRGAPPAELT
jgi:restriction system protein